MLSASRSHQTLILLLALDPGKKVAIKEEE
jgi:hypothetical protein